MYFKRYILSFWNYVHLEEEHLEVQARDPNLSVNNNEIRFENT
jgi:hypothetical protein